MHLPWDGRGSQEALCARARPTFLPQPQQPPHPLRSRHLKCPDFVNATRACLDDAPGTGAASVEWAGVGVQRPRHLQWGSELIAPQKMSQQPHTVTNARCGWSGTPVGVSCRALPTAECSPHRLLRACQESVHVRMHWHAALQHHHEMCKYPSTAEQQSMPA